MKNLKVLYLVQEKLNDIINPKFLTLNAENKSGEIYVTTNEKLLVCNVHNQSVKYLADVFGAVSCEYLTLNDEISLASEAGEVLIYKTLTNKLEEVTYCDGGIEMMSWSPDQEIVVFITKLQTMVLMNSSYDVISESNLLEDIFGEDAFVNVGWGKKETQFHGTEGKSAAKLTQDFAILDTKVLSTKINVSWRGDGELFAISFVGKYGRCFKVFDREGTLKSTSEKEVNDLDVVIAWRPSGSWIAIPHKKPNKSVIELFEKNGLRHREIVLPFDLTTEPIVNMKWNVESDILAIATEQSLYLYTICNYHWYLKQCTEYDQKIVDFTFDYSLNEQYTLHVLLELGTYIVYKFKFDIDHSYGDSEENQGSVAVVDGKDLLLTDFRNNLIPPPMFKLRVSESDFINSCGFLRNPMSFDEFSFLFTFRKDCVLNFYKCIFEKNNFSRKLIKVVLINSTKLNANNSAIHNMVWLTKDLFCYCFYEPQNKTSVQFINLEGTNVHSFLHDGIICATSHYAEDLLALSTDKEVFIVGPTIFEIRENVAEICHKIETFSAHIVALKTNSQLYVSGNCLAENVTSFHMTTNYLIFTQFDVMKFVRLSDIKIVEERRIERGGKLVTIVPSSARTILQMPRGNLEGINPRILSLEIIGELLDSLQYNKAMDIMRKERINLNILCDHNLILFFENLQTFIEDIASISWLNLFLSDLKNEDFTKTMYSGCYYERTPQYPSDENFSILNKVVIICEQLCKHMQEKDSSKYILPIITTYVKTNRIGNALEIVWNEREKESIEGEKGKSEEALTYLLYMVDVNNLFDVALGLYDFDLVLFVAAKSKKDPKEFLPFLNELNSYEENYRKFKIDEYLKKHEKAIENIAKCGEEHLDEALKFIEKHRVYRKALEQYKGHENCYKKICLSFAEYLRGQGKLENASIMYERAGDLSQAVQTAKNSLDWKRCLSLCERDEINSLAYSLIQALEGNGKYEEAFRIHKDYCNNIAESIKILLNGKLFLHAIFECRNGNMELMESVLKPELNSYYISLNGVLEADQQLFLKYRNRLHVVRELNAKKLNEAADFEPNVDECDILSDTTSNRSSQLSGSSSRTGYMFVNLNFIYYYNN
ncbi:IKBKAP family protein [Megaselia abdita]